MWRPGLAYGLMEHQGDAINIALNGISDMTLDESYGSRPTLIGTGTRQRSLGEGAASSLATSSSVALLMNAKRSPASASSVRCADSRADRVVGRYCESSRRCGFLDGRRRLSWWLCADDCDVGDGSGSGEGGRCECDLCGVASVDDLDDG